MANYKYDSKTLTHVWVTGATAKDITIRVENDLLKHIQNILTILTRGF